MLYWLGELDPPLWLGIFGYQVAVDRHLTKLPKTPFGISLEVADIDEFLFQKIKKKLRYWTTLFLSLPARAIVANSIPLLTLWYFIHI
jgi:hypothetical protein